MKKYISNFLILASSVIFSVAIISIAAAQSNSASSDAFSNLTYPITELGNCKDRNDCKIYCDDDANTAACINYAEKKNLLSQEDMRVAKNFIASGSEGPGNCTGKKECQTYCEDKNHIDECVSYAEEKGLMSSQDLQKAKKVQAAIKKGVKFPSCNTKKECDAYCEDPGHMEECIAFAQEAGLLSNQELQNSQKVLTAVKQGVKPPACKGKDACDVYCAEASHADECVNFAVAAGLVTSDEAKIIKKTGGKGPGGCKNKSECDSYCSNDANRETCMNFVIEHNIPQPQPPQQPGTDSNPVKCIDDCESTGRNCLGQAGDEGKVCASDGQYCRQVTCGDALFDAEGNRATGEAMHTCNDTWCTPTENTCHARVTAKDSACRTTKDQCVTQCQKASKPTKPTQPPQPGQPSQPPGQPGQGQPTLSRTGPGGCKTVEECQAYCQSHPEAKTECKQFKQSQKQGQSEQNQPMQNLNDQRPTQPSPPN